MSVEQIAELPNCGIAELGTRVQNTFYFAGTALQISLAMSAGLIAHRVSLTAAFALLGAVYGLAFIGSVWPVPAARPEVEAVAVAAE